MRRDSIARRPTRRTTTAQPVRASAAARLPEKGARSVNSRVSARPAWTFLTNHAHALLCVARNPGMRVREIAQSVGVTERRVQGIMVELERAGYVTRVHQGRRTFYDVHADLPLRHPVEQHQQVSELLSLVLGARGRRRDGEA